MPRGDRSAFSGKPIHWIDFFSLKLMSVGQVSDYTGAAALLSSLPKAGWLLADRSHDADWFIEALKDKGIEVVRGRFDPLDQILLPLTPGRKSRKKAVKYDKRRYKRRNRIEIMFGRQKDWSIVGKTVPRTVF